MTYILGRSERSTHSLCHDDVTSSFSTAGKISCTILGPCADVSRAPPQIFPAPTPTLTFPTCQHQCCSTKFPGSGSAEAHLWRREVRCARRSPFVSANYVGRQRTNGPGCTEALGTGPNEAQDSHKAVNTQVFSPRLSHKRTHVPGRLGSDGRHQRPWQAVNEGVNARLPPQSDARSSDEKVRGRWRREHANTDALAV